MHSPLASSPSDIADPSPIATSSSGTDTTDIDDTGEAREDLDPTPQPPKTAESPLKVRQLHPFTTKSNVLMQIVARNSERSQTRVEAEVGRR